MGVVLRRETPDEGIARLFVCAWRQAAKAKATGGEVPDIPDYQPTSSLDLSSGPKPQAAAAPTAPKPAASGSAPTPKAAPKKSEDPVAASKVILVPP